MESDLHETSSPLRDISIEEYIVMWKRLAHRNILLDKEHQMVVNPFYVNLRFCDGTCLDLIINKRKNLYINYYKNTHNQKEV